MQFIGGARRVKTVAPAYEAAPDCRPFVGRDGAMLVRRGLPLDTVHNYHLNRRFSWLQFES
jgi:hypothetical protein